MNGELIGQHLINALSIGSTYALLALGLAVVFSVLGLLNFAYGELITVTGYMMLFLVGTGAGFWWAGLGGVVTAVLASLAIERIAFRPLMGAPANAVIFASFAVSIAIQGLLINLISPRPQGIAVPAWVDEVLELGSMRVSMLPLVTIVVAGGAMLGLMAMLRHTRQGLAMRAAAEDFHITRLMGARAPRMVATAFALSGLLAGIAGLLWIARTGSVSPAMGFMPLLQAFVAIVLGGLGSLPGAVIGGFALGAIEVCLQVLLPQTMVPFTAALTLVAVVAILYFRPQGFAEIRQERVA